MFLKNLLEVLDGCLQYIILVFLLCIKLLRLLALGQGLVEKVVTGILLLGSL